MIYRVALTVEAERDLARLADFLAQHNESAARRAGGTIKAALRSLARLPDRVRRISDDLRELDIRFGKSGYVVQFCVMREDRRGSDD